MLTKTSAVMQFTVYVSAPAHGPALCLSFSLSLCFHRLVLLLLLLLLLMWLLLLLLLPLLPLLLL
eukprot:COSAG02_NODE_8654_length_2489_cov_2.025941_2_plen_65_part_00